MKGIDGTSLCQNREKENRVEVQAAMLMSAMAMPSIGRNAGKRKCPACQLSIMLAALRIGFALATASRFLAIMQFSAVYR